MVYMVLCKKIRSSGEARWLIESKIKFTILHRSALRCVWSVCWLLPICYIYARMC